MTHKWNGTDISEHWSDSVTNGINQMYSRNSAVKFTACAEMLLRLTGNILTNPDEPKFRQIRARNEKIKAVILSCDWADYTLQGLGFVHRVVDMEEKYIWEPTETAVDRLRLGQEELAKHLKTINDKASFDPKEAERREREEVLKVIRDDEQERARDRERKKAAAKAMDQMDMETALRSEQPAIQDAPLQASEHPPQ
eukprot:TRINITY_DN33340_c0_g1_i1.p1 TRINITY_DN33340_c0_g1~~TRINITY_DN33340_c0_g1_i1.p1  ORF type:complete len:197 (+),score=46.85 TRINITY_DN33340_c0_g1_i1:63-653(+)